MSCPPGVRTLARAAAWIGLLALPMGLGACRGSRSPAARREQERLNQLYGKDARLITKAPRCSTTVAVDTAGWKPAVANGRPLGFTLPPRFHQDTLTRFVHGGYRWADGDREFDVVRGDWKPRTLVQNPSDGCRTVVAGQPVLVVRSLDIANRLTLALWPYLDVPPAGRYGVLVEAVSPSLQDDPALWTMASRALPFVLTGKPRPATPPPAGAGATSTPATNP